MISNVNILATEVLSDNWYTLRKITYEYTKKDGSLPWFVSPRTTPI